MSAIRPSRDWRSAAHAHLEMQMALKQVFSVTSAKRGGRSGALPFGSDDRRGSRAGSRSTSIDLPEDASMRCGDDSRVYQTRTASEGKGQGSKGPQRSQYSHAGPICQALSGPHLRVSVILSHSCAPQVVRKRKHALKRTRRLPLGPL